MIGYLKGKLLYTEENTAVLEVNGVGYEAIVSTSCLKYLIDNKGGEIYTYLAVREDGVSLYGFISREEKKMFLKLITVSGVGPKMGITVLSQTTLKDLATMVATSDVKGLSKIKGLGKKTAERIILELREKMVESVSLSDEPLENASANIDDKDYQDAMLALLGLGFEKGECVKVLTKAKTENVMGVQAVIAYSLKNIR
jgi:Holliday junction DNA helicase RuvA